jgi:putative acetyltransferase
MGYMLIRPEQDTDRISIRTVNLAAFETAAEADLVDILRDQMQHIISLVAEFEGNVIGHIMFSPVCLLTDPSLPLMGLAPMAVLPEFQRGGVGSKLVEAGLECCIRQGLAAVVVLGHPKYYPQFGFLPAADFGMACEFAVPAEVFMAIELQPGAFSGKSGRVQYSAVFSDL